MRTCVILAASAAGVAALAAAPGAQADIQGLKWRTVSPTSFELYAEVDPGTTIEYVDSARTGAFEGKPNNGLFTSNGVVTITDYTFRIGSLLQGSLGFSVVGGFPAATPQGSGVLLESAWANTFPSDNPIMPAMVMVDGGEEILGTLLLVVNNVPEGTQLGGLGGADGLTQSTLFVSGSDADGNLTRDVFDVPPVPAPGAFLALAPAGLLAARRRR